MHTVDTCAHVFPAAHRTHYTVCGLCEQTAVRPHTCPRFTTNTHTHTNNSAQCTQTGHASTHVMVLHLWIHLANLHVQIHTHTHTLQCFHYSSLVLAVAALPSVPSSLRLYLSPRPVSFGPFFHLICLSCWLFFPIFHHIKPIFSFNFQASLSRTAYSAHGHRRRESLPASVVNYTCEQKWNWY